MRYTVGSIADMPALTCFPNLPFKTIFIKRSRRLFKFHACNISITCNDWDQTGSG